MKRRCSRLLEPYGSPLASSETALRSRLTGLVVSAIVAGALRHLIKAIVARRRPDRSVTEPRSGIGKSGSAWNSFPSGHAVHLGAIAGPLASLAPPHLRPFVWPAIDSLAATRIVILAHYMTDVLAGMASRLALTNGQHQRYRTKTSVQRGYGERVTDRVRQSGARNSKVGYLSDGLIAHHTCVASGTAPEAARAEIYAS
jgi:PAP2 superfamily